MNDEEPKKRKLPQLGNNRNDVFISQLRALLGPLPVGSLIVEIVTNIIPNQRQDRVEEYLRLLTERVNQIAYPSWNPQSITQPKKIALIEAGAVDAARSISKERMQYIVGCVANGLTDHERSKIHHNRLLGILAQLDDEEILILNALATDQGQLDRLRPPPLVIGASDDIADQNAMWDSAWSRLETMNLIRFRQDTEDLGRIGQSVKVPAVDPFGHRKGIHFVTHLGTMVLKSIGLGPANADR
jgi:hypothetical protein